MLETRKHHLSPRCRTYGMVLEEFLPSLKRNFSCPTAERAASFILRSPSPFSQRTLHRNFDQMRPSNNNRHTRLQQRQNDLPLACCHNHSQWLFMMRLSANSIQDVVQLEFDGSCRSRCNLKHLFGHFIAGDIRETFFCCLSEFPCQGRPHKLHGVVLGNLRTDETNLFGAQRESFHIRPKKSTPVAQRKFQQQSTPLRRIHKQRASTQTLEGGTDELET
mmetsp:Transcript_119/g.278  ORF Transcript_119/g.278 Transcript_119/m.278 type:complete len:220 (+) Transcript_119:1298-1957(+)